MTLEEIRVLIRIGQDEAQRVSQQLGKPVNLDHNALAMLARMAAHQPDSDAYMRLRVRQLVDDLTRRDPDAASYDFQYEPPDADEKRQARCQEYLQEA